MRVGYATARIEDRKISRALGRESRGRNAIICGPVSVKLDEDGGLRSRLGGCMEGLEGKQQK